MRADRLISILLLLQNNGRMKTRELADILEVSERTIHRDMEALSAAGIPIYAERGVSGGWRLAEGYRTNLTGMKSEEVQSLLLAHSSNLLHDLGLADVFKDAFQKLLAALPSRHDRDAEMVRQRIHIDGAGWHQRSEELPYLSLVQEAVWHEQKLQISYQREQGEVLRIVEPLGLVAKGSIWYLIAQIEGELRTYRVSRITNASLLEESFQRPSNFDLAAYWEESTRQFTANLPQYPARIRFSEAIMSRLAKHPYVKLLEIRKTKSEWAEAEVEFHTLESACDILLGCGATVEVLEPVELRDALLAQAQAIVSIYQLKH